MSNSSSKSLPDSVKSFLFKRGITEKTSMLVGVSGGVDSMVLLNVLFEMAYTISVGHVNFNLRGDESDEDALFVREWCKQRNIPFYILNKITKTLESELRINTQTAARKIRYNWWDRLAIKHKFENICTAHHLDDSIETMLINQFRGSGIKGLRGIPQNRGIYLRPLLECTKADIEDYAKTYEVPFRMDSSNLKDDYQRNRIRHHLIPLLKELYPGLHSSMSKTISRVNTEWETFDVSYNTWVSTNIISVHGGIKIKSQEGTNAFILRWLELKGFPWLLASDYIQAPGHDTGINLEHEAQRLSRTDFGFFLEDITSPTLFRIEKPGRYVYEEFELAIEPVPNDQDINFDDPWTEYVHPSALNWPLLVRNVAPGDVFQPFGMDGKRKKMQDFMVDLKLEMYQKRKLLILENQEHIMWVIGHRLDERSRISKEDQQVFRIQFRSKRATKKPQKR